MSARGLALSASLLTLTLAAVAPEPIPRAAPERVGLASARLRDATDLLSRFVTERKIAGAVAAVARKGKLAYLETVGVPFFFLTMAFCAALQAQQKMGHLNSGNLLVMNLQPIHRNSVTMNTTASAQSVITRAMSQPHAPRSETESAFREATSPGTPPRLTVWEERARKMGFPPSPR